MISRTDKFIVAAAQSNSLAGDTESNVRTHLRFVPTAIEHSCDLLVFPELSLTGYEPELAAKLTMTPDDDRLAPLRERVQQSETTIMVGAPIACSGGKPYIGAIVLSSDRSLVYRKQHLHEGEDKFFSPGNSAGLIDVKGASVGLAICADIANPAHAEQAAAL